MVSTELMNEKSQGEQQEGTVVKTEKARANRVYRPYIDIQETPEELTLLADLPGASADGVDVTFENGTLTLHAKVADRGVTGANYLWREYGVGDFHREFTVSEAIDAERIQAEFRDGVLTLHLPKTPVAKPRRITVNAG